MSSRRETTSQILDIKLKIKRIQNSPLKIGLITNKIQKDSSYRSKDKKITQRRVKTQLCEDKDYSILNTLLSYKQNNKSGQIFKTNRLNTINIISPRKKYIYQKSNDIITNTKETQGISKIKKVNFNLYSKKKY